MKIKTTNIENLDECILTSPFIFCKSGYSLVEIDVSASETQVFLLCGEARCLFVENNFWMREQCDLVRRALYLLNNGLIKPKEIQNRTVLAGVWHFGHLIGDHAHNLIELSLVGTNRSIYPIHVSSEAAGIKAIGRLFDLELFFTKDNPTLVEPIRFYKLDNCYCRFPARDKSYSLSTAHYHWIRRTRIIHDKSSCEYSKVFLTSGRKSRISDICDLTLYLQKNKWLILNPSICPLKLVLQIVGSASYLISENGSILFNCFLSRTSPYFVLSSSRAKQLSPASVAGGGVYNQFHLGLINYVWFPPQSHGHHPYSDQIKALPELLTLCSL